MVEGTRCLQLQGHANVINETEAEGRRRGRRERRRGQRRRIREDTEGRGGHLFLAELAPIGGSLRRKVSDVKARSSVFSLCSRSQGGKWEKGRGKERPNGERTSRRQRGRGRAEMGETSDGLSRRVNSNGVGIYTELPSTPASEGIASQAKSITSPSSPSSPAISRACQRRFRCQIPSPQID